MDDHRRKFLIAATTAVAAAVAFRIDSSSDSEDELTEFLILKKLYEARKLDSLSSEKIDLSSKNLFESDNESDTSEDSPRRKVPRLENNVEGIEPEAHLRSKFPPTYVEGFHDAEAVKAMEYKELGKTGLLVSKLSFGTGPLGCHYGTYDETDAIEAVRQAIKQGVNYIDTAPWYGKGRSETTLGKALKEIPREAYYIATKVGRYELNYDDMFDFTIEKTRKSFMKSLELLGVNYVDVIQVHDIEFAPSLDIIVTQTLPELSRQVAEGKARHIGITGYPVSVLKECIEKSNINIACILSYSRLTLIDDTLLKYIPFFKERNIGLINAAAPCMGLLTNDGPPSWHLASDETKKQCASAGQYCKERDVELCKLAIWHSLQYTDIGTNLVGIQTTEQLHMNLDILRNGITEKEKALLQEVQEKFLLKVKNQHWEGKEIQVYQKAMKNKI